MILKPESMILALLGNVVFIVILLILLSKSKTLKQQCRCAGDKLLVVISRFCVSSRGLAPKFASGSKLRTLNQNYKGVQALHEFPVCTTLHAFYPSLQRARNDNATPMSSGRMGKRCKVYALSERGYSRGSYNNFNKLGRTKTRLLLSPH